jgi:tRNA(Ile)-lysidine synthase
MGPAPAVAAVRSAVRSALAAGAATPGCARRVPLPAGQQVLVACSGGADSLALAAATAFEADRAGVVAGLITVDHGLSTGSSGQAARVGAIGYELGLDPVLVVPVSVGSAGGPEAAARVARYAALDAAAEALDAAILLGHTLDDQAETVLLGLGRGSGPRSLAGMASVDARYLRPFLQLRRATTEAACTALGLDPWTDPHNADPRFQRVRLRHEVLPLLEDVLHGGVAEALARTADLLGDDLEALDTLAAAALTDATGDQAGELEVAALAALPRAVRTRVLRAWAAGQGAEPLTAERTQALDALVTAWHGQGPIELPGGVAVRRASGRLVVFPDLQE